MAADRAKAEKSATGQSRERGKSGRGRGRPRPEDAAAIESRLLAIALQEFLQHGYGEASMARIIEVAGVSKTTLYSRFPAKDQLFRAIIHQQIDNLSPSTVLQTNAAPLTLEQGLKSYANHMLELNLQGDLLGVNRLIYAESHRFPELGAAAAERTELGIERIASFISACADRDGVPCTNPNAVAEVFILVMRGWYTNVLLTNQQVTDEQRRHWVDRAVHCLLSGRAQW